MGPVTGLVALPTAKQSCATKIVHLIGYLIIGGEHSIIIPSTAAVLSKPSHILL